MNYEIYKPKLTAYISIKRNGGRITNPRWPFMVSVIFWTLLLSSYCVLICIVYPIIYHLRKSLHRAVLFSHFDGPLVLYCYLICTSIWTQGEAENARAIFSYNSTVLGGHVEDNHLHLHISESKDLENHDDASPLLPQLVLIPKLVINSAGLSALPLAKRFCGLDHNVIPAAYYARGCYFTLSKTKNPPFSHLIYPIPEDGGLGVHVTLDLNGLIKFGPDVEWIDGVDDISFFNRYF